MTYVYGHHKVRDFHMWKPYFDKDDERRQAAGVRLVRLFQAANDPNEIHFLFEADDPSAMQEMMDSNDIKQTMEKAGVISEPQIHVLTSVT
ncbi:cyclase [Candidatus Pacearchaeota archaeon]|nr:cyclase [Candidatus Pacearchaeota archaeon]